MQQCWLVWGVEQEKEEALEIFDVYPGRAAEQWAKEEDNSQYYNTKIVDGEFCKVFVESKEDPGRVSTWVVYGELVPTYTAKFLK
jgi:hypothetical protein